MFMCVFFWGFMDEFVDEILKLANVAFELDEVPVGAVVVSGNKIVGKG